MTMLVLICRADSPGKYPPEICKPKTNVPHPLLEVEGGSSHQQVDLIACKAFEKVSVEPVVGFQMAYNRLYGGTSLKAFSHFILHGF